jgi:PKD repeat protein
MRGRGLVVGPGAVLATLVLASSAAAAPQTYCVHVGGACPAGQVDIGSDLQAALTGAVSNPGSTVLIGPGTFTHPSGFSVAPGSPVDMTITGAGAGRTILEATGSTPGYVFGLRATAASTLSGVTIGITPGVGGGLTLDGATANGIAVALEPGGGLAAGANVLSGATIEHSSIQGGNVGVQANTAASPATLVDDTISAPTAIFSADTTLTGQDLTITGASVAVLALGTTDTTTIDDLLAVVSPGLGQSAVQATGGAAVVVRSATLVDVGTASATGVFVSGANTHTSLTLNDSIVRGFPIANARSASGGSGAADLTLNDDDITLAADSGAAGTFTHTGDIDADPRFVNPAAGDYRLRFGSPAIDVGGNCASICQTVPDLDGLTRPIDGNGDGAAVRDVGAYEYGHRAPAARVAASSPSATAGQVVTFDASASSDPDDGDALTYAWTFDDGSTASGPSAGHAFATPGVHTATLTVTDPAGLTGTATASVTVAAVRDTTAPAISALKLSHSTFAVAKGSTATIAATHSKGTTIRFRLSEAAKVTFAIARATGGVEVGKSCVAPSKRHRHGKACTRYVKAGTLTRRSERAGADSLAFTGRIGHKALHTGHYHVTLTATDAAGNASKAKTASFTIVSH